MATLSFNIPDAAMPRVIDAFCGAYGYRDVLPGGQPNPQNRQQFTREQILTFMRSTVRAWEGQVASSNAAQAASVKADQEVVIT